MQLYGWTRPVAIAMQLDALDALDAGSVRIILYTHRPHVLHLIYTHTQTSHLIHTHTQRSIRDHNIHEIYLFQNPTSSASSASLYKTQ